MSIWCGCNLEVHLSRGCPRYKSLLSESGLHPGDPNTDSEEERARYQLLQRAAQRQELEAVEQAETVTRVATTLPIQQSPSRPEISRSQSYLGIAFGSLASAFQASRHQTTPGAFLDTPERAERPRGWQPPERPGPPPPPPPEPETATMADPPPPRIPPSKIPAPAKFSGEGDDLKPDKLERWLPPVERYISRYHMTEANTPEIVDWYGGLTEGRAEGAFLTFMKDKEQPPTLEEFIAKFEQLFESSTNTYDLYRKWQKVHQHSGGKPGRITKVVGDLEDIKAALPDEAITEYAYKQRFLDAMDIRLRGNVESQI